MENRNGDEDKRSDEMRRRRRREIIEASISVFADRGYHKASIADIIRTAGIARGTFYLYFAGKHEVFESILDSAREELLARITAVEVGPDLPPPNVQFASNIVRVLTFILENRNLSKLLLDHGLSPNDEVAQKIEGFYDHVESLIESSIQQGIDMGLVHRSDAALTAAASFGAIRGVIAHLLAKKGPIDLDKVAGELLEFALHGTLGSMD